MAELPQDHWVDPVHHDPLRDGPPYLPGNPKGRVASTVSIVRRASVKRAQLTLGSELEVVFERCLSEYGGAPSAELAVLLAALRAEAMIHQAHHWQTRGTSFYGDHQLFERIYGAVEAFIDPLAEKTVGVGHYINVQPLLQAGQMVAYAKVFYGDAPVSPGPEEFVLLSLRTVLKSALTLTYAYKSLEGKGQLTLGVDNFLQGIADKQEELIYLLKQRSQTRTAAVHKPSDPVWKHENIRSD